MSCRVLKSREFLLEWGIFRTKLGKKGGYFACGSGLYKAPAKCQLIEYEILCQTKFISIQHKFTIKKSTFLLISKVDFVFCPNNARRFPGALCVTELVNKWCIIHVIWLRKLGTLYTLLGQEICVCNLYFIMTF